MYNRNAVHDFKVLEEKESQRGRVVKLLPSLKKRQKERLKAQKMFFTSVFSLFSCIAVGVSAYILGQATLTEFTDKSAKAYKELEECKSVNIGLAMKLESAEVMSKNNSFKNNNDDVVEVIKIHKSDKAKIK